MYYRGEWGAVAGDLWDIDDATVVCRQLGYGRATAAEVKFYRRKVWMNRVVCRGKENTLQQCSFAGWGNCDNCVKGLAAKVACGKNVLSSAFL